MPVGLNPDTEPIPHAPQEKGEVLASEKQDARVPVAGDRAMAQFSAGSLYAITNQYGVSKPFIQDPKVAPFTTGKPVPGELRTAKHPVQYFWVYDGAQPTLAAQGKIQTSRDQILPNKRITEQQAVEWNRVGSKKGWMFNGSPQQQGPGATGENVPTHTDDGYIGRIAETRWFPIPRSEAKQGVAAREFPAIDIENNARGIGVTGAGSGSGGMQGGYKDVNKQRLQRLPIPMAKYNWTGTRLTGTARENEDLGSGAGGFRAGYASAYPDRPSFPQRRTNGLSRVTQNAA